MIKVISYGGNFPLPFSRIGALLPRLLSLSLIFGLRRPPETSSEFLGHCLPGAINNLILHPAAEINFFPLNRLIRSSQEDNAFSRFGHVGELP